jgi:seryl-tRNA synthetase
MKYLIFIFLCGCGLTAQEPSKEQKMDIEFQQLLNKVNESNANSSLVQDAATHQQKKIITHTIQNINNLKTELNEVKAKLDSISVDTGSSFLLLPIPKK